MWPEPALLTSDEGIVLALNEDARRLLGDAAGTGVALGEVVGGAAADALLDARNGTAVPLLDLELDVPLRARAGRCAAGGLLVALTDDEGGHRLRAHIEQAERLASIGELLSSVAHELNNPLTSVLGYAELLLAENNPGLPREEVERIRSEAERCRRIVQNLLDLSRAERLEMRPLLLQDVVAKVVEFRAYAAQVAGIELRTEVEQDLPFVMGDLHRLTQAVLNLVTNAEYAVSSRAAGRQVSVRARRVGGSVAIDVEDNGAGVPLADAEAIFQPFFTTKPRGRGTGLGLSLVRATAESHGGSARVERAATGGARFVIELPPAEGA